MVGEEMKEAEKEGGWSLTRKGENKDVQGDEKTTENTGESKKAERDWKRHLLLKGQSINERKERVLKTGQ